MSRSNISGQGEYDHFGESDTPLPNQRYRGMRPSSESVSRWPRWLRRELAGRSTPDEPHPVAKELIAVHHTIFAVDVEGYGSPHRTNADRLTIRAGVYSVLQQALNGAGLGWQHCYRADRGDGVLVLAPATAPKAPFSEMLPQLVTSSLLDYNSSHGPAKQFRLRAVLHAGEITHDEHGADGAAIVHATRLLDSSALKTALAESGSAVAFIASAWFYDEVIRHSPASSPYAYNLVEVQVKETKANAWIYLPPVCRATG